jgi:hypothetical protein
MNRLFSSLLAGAFFCCTGVHAREYRFINVVDTTMASPTGGSFTDFRNISIDGRAVAFIAGDTAVGHGVFTANDGKLTTIVRSREPGLGNELSGFHNLDISGETVAFMSYTGNQSSEGILTGNGGPLTTIAKRWDTPLGGLPVFGFIDLSFDGDTVAFTSTRPGIFGSTNGNIALLAAPGDPAPLGIFTSMYSPKLSGNTLAFMGASKSNYEYVDGIFTKTNGQVATIVKLWDPAPSGVFEYFTHLSLSRNRVAFLGQFEDGNGIFTGNGGPLTTIVKRGDPAPVGKFGEVVRPVICGNSVVFLGFYADEFDQGGHGIFTGSGGPLTSVIGFGDPLFGSTVTTFFQFDTYYERDFAIDPNGDGTLAFRYALADGRTALRWRFRCRSRLGWVSCSVFPRLRFGSAAPSSLEAGIDSYRVLSLAALVLSHFLTFLFR